MITTSFFTACTHLSQLLCERSEPLILGLGVGRQRAAERGLSLQLQQAAHVVGLLAGRLLQQRLLIALPILGHLALGGVGLAECLSHTTTSEDGQVVGQMVKNMMWVELQTQKLSTGICVGE